MLPVFYCSQRWVRQDRQEQSCSLKRQPLIPRCSGFLLSAWPRSETKAWAHRTEKYCWFALLSSASKRASPSIPTLGLEHPHPIPPPEQTVPGCPAGVPGFFEMLVVLWPHVMWKAEDGRPPAHGPVLPKPPKHLPVWAHGAWAADDLEALEAKENETPL